VMKLVCGDKNFFWFVGVDLVFMLPSLFGVLLNVCCFFFIYVCNQKMTYRMSRTLFSSYLLFLRLRKQTYEFGVDDVVREFTRK